ncbi:MAG TPA: hypothetical protein VGR34_06470 [Candidatus Dormibacteraeota bacterium]|nr:hypothetical protein [Candidatus Dormibacteraeota bacterium]
MKLLDQLLVTRYAKYRALKNLLDKWLDEKYLEILAAMRAGARCPELGPYLLELGKAEDRPNWKEEFFDYLVAQGGKQNALKTITTIAERKRPKSPRLYCKRNASYKRKFPIRLPR